MNRRYLLPAIKAFMFFVIIGLLWWTSRQPQVRELFDTNSLPERIASMGNWAPLAYIGLFIFGALVFVPPTIMVLVSGVLFGQWMGFLMGLVGVNVSAAVGFWLVRILGKDAVMAVLPMGAVNLEKKLSKSGFKVVLYLRLAFVPFWMVNYASGLSSVRFSNFMLATFIGTFPAVFSASFLGDRLRELTSTGNIMVLLDPMGILAIALFVAAFFAPFVIKRPDEDQTNS